MIPETDPQEKTQKRSAVKAAFEAENDMSIFEVG